MIFDEFPTPPPFSHLITSYCSPSVRGPGRQLHPPAVNLLRPPGVPHFRPAQGAVLLEVVFQEPSVQPKLSHTAVRRREVECVDGNKLQTLPAHTASFRRGACITTPSPSFTNQEEATRAQTDLTHENYAQSTRPPRPTDPFLQHPSAVQLLEIYYKSKTRANPDRLLHAHRTLPLYIRSGRQHMVPPPFPLGSGRVVPYRTAE